MSKLNELFESFKENYGKLINVIEVNDKITTTSDVDVAMLDLDVAAKGELYTIVITGNFSYDIEGSRGDNYTPQHFEARNVHTRNVDVQVYDQEGRELKIEETPFQNDNGEIDKLLIKECFE